MCNSCTARIACKNCTCNHVLTIAFNPVNVTCPFQVDGAEWLHAYTIFKFGAICILGDMSRRARKNTSMNFFLNRFSPNLRMQKACQMFLNHRNRSKHVRVRQSEGKENVGRSVITKKIQLNICCN